MPWRTRRERIRRGASRRQRTARRAEARAEGDASPPAREGALAPPDEHAGDEAGAGPLESSPAHDGPVAPPRGLWARLRGLWPGATRARPGEGAAVAPADDPVLRILAVPRGVARLQAFEALLSELGPRTHGHRSVSLAYSRELEHLSGRASLDPALLGPRLEACARALEATGLPEKAAPLWLQLGQRERAQALFTATGDLEALGASHEATLSALGGTPRAAQAAYERAEALLALGRRGEGLASLRQAVCLAPDHAHYPEVLARSLARAIHHRVRLEWVGEAPSTRDALQVSAPAWPRIIGRDEGADVQLRGPRVSRAHVELERVGDALVARNISGRGGVTCDGEPLDGPRALGEAGVLEIMGVALRYHRTPEALLLRAGEGQSTWALLEREDACLALAPHLSLRLSWQPDGTLLLRANPALHFGGVPLREDLLLWQDDVLEGPGGSLQVRGGFLQQPAGQAGVLG